MSLFYCFLSTFFSLLLAVQCACRDIIIKNNCNVTLWPAYASASNDHEPLANIFGGYEANENTSHNITVPDGWEGLIWTRQVCDFSQGDLESCMTGSCPGGKTCTGVEMSKLDATVAEFTHFPSQGINNSLWYDINISGGFNVAMEIRDLGCNEGTLCGTDFTASCPVTMQAATSDGTSLACKMDPQLTSWYAEHCNMTIFPGSNGAPLKVCGNAPISVTFCPDGTAAAPLPKELEFSSGSSIPTQSGGLIRPPSSTPTALGGDTVVNESGSTSSPTPSTAPSALSTIFASMTSNVTASDATSPAQPSHEISQSQSAHKPSIGVVIGAAVAGSAACICAIGVLLLCIRRRKGSGFGIPNPLPLVVDQGAHPRDSFTPMIVSGTSYAGSSY